MRAREVSTDAISLKETQGFPGIPRRLLAWRRDLTDGLENVQSGLVDYWT